MNETDANTPKAALRQAQMSAIVSIAIVAFVIAKAALSFQMNDFRMEWLNWSYQGLKSTGAPLVWWYQGHYSIAGWSDDHGLYLFAPYLAIWLRIGVLSAAQLILAGSVFAGAVAGMLGVCRLTNSTVSRLYAALVYSALGWTVLSTGFRSVYVLQAVLPMAGIPWLLVAFKDRDRPAKWSEAALFAFGVIGSVFNLMRGHSATALFIAAAILVAWSKAPALRKVRLVGLMVAGALIVSVAMVPVYHARNDFLAHSPQAAADRVSGKDSHMFWHPIYIGLGFFPNKYVSEFSDKAGVEKVQSVDPSIGTWTDLGRHEAILKAAIIELVRRDPGFMLSQLLKKAYLLMRFLLFTAGLQWLPNVGLLALAFRRPSLRITAAFLAMLVFDSAFGLLVVPHFDYVIGFAAVAAVFAVVAAIKALDSTAIA